MSEIRIEELLEKNNIDDSNLIIVEDNDDTKKSTILELKRCIIGDSENPSEYKTYSSEYIHECLNSIIATLSYKPSRSEFENLVSQVNNIIKSGGSSGSSTKDTEIITARGTYSTLAERLAGDIAAADSKYIQFPVDTFTGIDIDLSSYKSGSLKISIPQYNTNTNLYIKGVNRFDGSAYNSNKTYAEVTTIENNTGLKFSISPSRYLFTIPFGTILSAGEYHFYSTAEVPSILDGKTITLSIIFSDGTISTIPFSFSQHISFTIFKPATAFRLDINQTDVTQSCVIIMHNIMISKDKNLNGVYHKFADQTISLASNTAKNMEFNNLQDIDSVSRSAGLLIATVLDASFSGTEIRNRIESLEDTLLDTVDKCGLIEDYGKYIYCDHVLESDNDLCVISTDTSKSRNGHASSKIKLMEHSAVNNPRFTLPLSDTINIKNINTISIQLYIDVTIYEHFSDSDGITLMFSSDQIRSNPPINYFYINLARTRFNQGWNTIKFKTSELTGHGNPDKTNITMINFKIFTNDFTSGTSFWINSIILDQRMKPTVLWAFDDTHDGTFNYQYPLLYSNNIPATIFFNDKRTMTRDEMEKYCTLVFDQGWEIGNYGCNPNKENMARDDNAREQYLGIVNNLTYLRSNFCNTVTSYAAPYGNLRPVTVNILRDLGFKIAKATSSSYCSFFSDEDLVIPMHLLSNTTTSTEIINKIKYCIETGQTICIYTSDVTKYGDEISAKKESFEAVVKFIKSQMDIGKLQCLTFKDFYNQCVGK